MFKKTSILSAPITKTPWTPWRTKKKIVNQFYQLLCKWKTSKEAWIKMTVIKKCCGGHFPPSHHFGMIFVQFCILFHSTLTLVVAPCSHIQQKLLRKCNCSKVAHHGASVYSGSEEQVGDTKRLAGTLGGVEVATGGQHTSRTTVCGMRAGSHWARNRYESLDLLWRTFCCLERPSVWFGGMSVIKEAHNSEWPHRPPLASQRYPDDC